MLKDLSLLVCFASFDIVNCLKPPRPPKIYLPGEKFSLPPICSISTEWQNVPLCLKLLSDINEPTPEISGYTSLMNLIKFKLIKEEMSCDNMSTLLPKRQGKLPKAVKTLQNSQILTKIDAALKKKPVKILEAVEINDNIDVPNMIPIMKPRGTRRRGKIGVQTEPLKSKTTCQGPKVMKTQNGPILLIGLKPITNILGPNAPCHCAKCPPVRNLASIPSNPRSMQCQRLPTTDINPIILGRQNCNLCQKLSSPVMTGCPMMRPVMLPGCPKLTAPVIRSGFLGCSGCSSCSQAKSALCYIAVRNNTSSDCYGNMLKKSHNNGIGAILYNYQN